MVANKAYINDKVDKRRKADECCSDFFLYMYIDVDIIQGHNVERLETIDGLY